jgi:DNA-binding MarR family transcriptional regulator
MPEWNEETQGLLQTVLKRRRSPKGRRRVNLQLTNALAAALEEIDRRGEALADCMLTNARLTDQVEQAEQRVKELEETGLRVIADHPELVGSTLAEIAAKALSPEAEGE